MPLVPQPAKNSNVTASGDVVEAEFRLMIDVWSGGEVNDSNVRSSVSHLFRAPVTRLDARRTSLVPDVFNDFGHCSAC